MSTFILVIIALALITAHKTIGVKPAVQIAAYGILYGLLTAVAFVFNPVTIIVFVAIKRFGG